MTNRVHIDAPAGVIEIEGEKEFVQGLLDKLFPLIEIAGFGSKPLASEGAETTALHQSDTLDDTASEQTKKKRRPRTATPKGQSCADRILVLKEDGFFKQHRSGTDIVKALATKGWTHKSNQVAAATGGLFARNALQRTKEESGNFKYYWDRD